MRDTSHLVALQESLSREKARYATANNENDRTFREHCITIKQREIEAEYKFLGMAPDSELPEISDDDLLAELLG